MQEHGRYHCTVLARNEIGYKGILEVQNSGAKKGNKFTIMDLDYLSKFSDNITVLTGCSSSYIVQQSQGGDEEHIIQLLSQWQERFKYLYTEFQPNPDFVKAYKHLFNVSSQLGIPYVVTNDIHYSKKEDYVLYNDIHRIMTKKESQLELKWLYPWTDQELNSYFIQQGFPSTFVKEAIANSQQIADETNIELNFGRKWEFEEDINRAWAVCRDKLESLYLSPEEKIEHLKRLSYEMKVFTDLELVGYLLFCKDILDNCRVNNIPYGPGRGSCCGSLVCYLLGVTEINPLVHDLSFDRFISPSSKIGLIEEICQ